MFSNAILPDKSEERMEVVNQNKKKYKGEQRSQRAKDLSYTSNKDNIL